LNMETKKVSKPKYYYRRFCERCNKTFRPTGRCTKVCDKCKEKIMKDVIIGRNIMKGETIEYVNIRLLIIGFFTILIKTS